MSNSSNNSDGPSWSVMGNSTCLDPNSAEAIWPYCPSEAAAILFTVLFFATTTANIVFAAKYKTSFCWTLIMGAAWEFLGFGVRAAATHYQQSMSLYVPQLLLTLLAPLWINAFVYMLFARVVHYFDETQKVGFIRATKLSVLFVCLDLVSFTVQLAGASMLTSSDANTLKIGKYIYMSGIGFQEAFIIIFASFVIRFHVRARRSQSPRPTRYLPTIISVYVSLALITIRIIFRCVEYSQGFDSPIPHTEAYQYVFDAVPMFVATLLWVVMHPGRVLVGDVGQFPTRAEKKFAKTERKARKQMEKDDKQARKEDEGLLGSGDATPLRGVSPARWPRSEHGRSPSAVFRVPSPSPYDPPSTTAYYGAGLGEEGRLAPNVPVFGRVE